MSGRRTSARVPSGPGAGSGHRGAARSSGEMPSLFSRRDILVRMAATYLCRGCGEPLKSDDDVRAVYRELSDPEGGHRTGEPRWGYTHLGHEPVGSGYRVRVAGAWPTLKYSA